MQFKNITDEDRDVRVDGASIFAPAGGTFEVPDAFAGGLLEQPYFERVGNKKTSAKVAVETTEGDN